MYIMKMENYDILNAKKLNVFKFNLIRKSEKKINWNQTPCYL